MQHGAFDSPRCVLVCTIVFGIDGRSRSIFLANSMNTVRLAISGNIFFENLWAERTLAEGIMEHGFGRTEKILLRKWLLLRQQNPWPISLREARIRPVPRFEDGNHVEYSETLHVLRMIQGHAVADASSAIMADQREGRKSELVHHFD